MDAGNGWGPESTGGDYVYIATSEGKNKEQGSWNEKRDDGIVIWGVCFFQFNVVQEKNIICFDQIEPIKLFNAYTAKSYGWKLT